MSDQPNPPGLAVPQAHVLLRPAEGANREPNLFPRLVRTIWRGAPTATTLMRPGALAVITEGGDAIDLIEQVVLPLVVAESKGTVAVAQSWVVADPEHDHYANLGHMAMLDLLAAADLDGALGHWKFQGRGRQAALHLVNPLAWAERTAELCTAALGEVAALEVFTPDDVVEWTTEYTSDQEWWLFAPLLAHALTHDALSSAFEPGETVDVSIVGDAALGIAASALARAGALRGVPARTVLDELLAPAPL